MMHAIDRRHINLGLVQAHPCKKIPVLHPLLNFVYLN